MIEPIELVNAIRLIDEWLRIDTGVDEELSREIVIYKRDLEEDKTENIVLEGSNCIIEHDSLEQALVEFAENISKNIDIDRKKHNIRKNALNKLTDEEKEVLGL